MTKRIYYLLLYLALIVLLTGPMIIQQVTGVLLVRTLPFAAGYFLMAANALPLMVIFAFDRQGLSTSNSLYWLALLMALQLWPLFYLSIHPALPSAPVRRFLFLVYCVGLALFVLVAWLVITVLPSLG